MSACNRRQQYYALPDPQPSKHEALNQSWFDAGRRRWARIGPTLGQNLVFAESVDRPHCVSHIAGCEDIKTVAQLIELKDDLATVDTKNGFHHIQIHSLYCPQESFNNNNYKSY